MHPSASAGLMIPFALLAVALVVAWPALVARAGRALGAPPAQIRRQVALTATVWLAMLVGSAALAASGVLRRWDAMPPPILLMLLGLLVLTLGLAASRAGAWLAQGLSYAWLIGLQAFRLPLELAMHAAAEAGLMPPQMTWTGLNLDVLTGATALLLAVTLTRTAVPRPVLVAWNAMGHVLLLVVATVGILSLPLPFRVFMNEPANVWLTWLPFVWLPAVMVMSALFGHVVLWRKLRTRPDAR